MLVFSLENLRPQLIDFALYRPFSNAGGKNKMKKHKNNGGWCMHDEATCHYIDMIDQTTMGHRLIKQQFNKIPRVGWQIDPFGHSAVQAYLFGAELGFDSLFFARIDYQDRAKRKVDKSLEVIWQGSKTFGSSSQDNPRLFDHNVEQRVNDFVAAAMNQANVTRTNHIMWTMGDDFQYQYAESWFKQMDKLIHYVNKDGRVNALYSTPSIYTSAKNAANESWPLKTDDYFPYADSANAYWTGFFTSRPALKRYTRMLSGYYLAARQLEFIAGKRSPGPNTFSLGDALGIVQHHDAVTGTAKQHTTNDYAKRLALGASENKLPVLDLRKEQVTDFCQLLNISYCPPTEEIPENKSLNSLASLTPLFQVVVAYNPLGWLRIDIVKIPVSDGNHVVRDSEGNLIEAQYVDLDNDTIKLRNFYTKAYLGVSPKQVPKYWLLFRVAVPPLGWNTYFISKVGEEVVQGSGSMSVVETSQNETLVVGPGDLKMSFSLTSGQLKRVINYKTGEQPKTIIQKGRKGASGLRQRVRFQNSRSKLKDVFWKLTQVKKSQSTISEYNCSNASGGYTYTAKLPLVPLKIVRGPLVDEVYQQFSPWIYQVTRLYKEKDHAEFEFTIGPIPVDDSVGKEVITKLTANTATDKTFYTDSNGRDFLKRVRDYRQDWPLQVTQPVAGNYYPVVHTRSSKKFKVTIHLNRKTHTLFPISMKSLSQLNLGMYTSDGKSELSVLVDRATGGASIQDGELELMLHRRMIVDDSRGVGEPLDEMVCVANNCEGLTVRGNYYVSIDPLGGGARWRRTDEQSWKASHLTNATSMDPSYTLPPNVALITLQELEDGDVLLRLAHLYEAGEDADYSTLAKVELKKIFAGRMIASPKMQRILILSCIQSVWFVASEFNKEVDLIPRWMYSRRGTEIHVRPISSPYEAYLLISIKEVKETSLSTNQDKSEMRSMEWRVEGDSGKNPALLRGGPVDNTNLVVELGPMEIRTFLLKF
ncbi:hypothetical protein ACLOJK_028025 [Asimina triloba]